MDLPVNPPLKPMLAKSTTKLPTDGSCIFEPKWDGFRCIIFRDGDEVVLGSRNEKPMTRYFPELIQPIRDALPERCAVDGELLNDLERELQVLLAAPPDWPLRRRSTAATLRCG